MTSYGKQILALVQETRGHLSAEDIFWQMKQNNPRVVLATVYNNLKALTQQGLIRKVTVEGQADRYDRVTRHDHLLCAVCGGLSDVVLPDMTDWLREKTGENVLGYDLKLSYTCPECQKARKN